jgi:SAM-dependent methyltransferase
MSPASTSAGRFDSLYRDRFGSGRHDWLDEHAATEILGFVDRLLPLTGITGGDLLELGCGTGTLSFPLATRGYRVTGLDISAVAIARARHRALAARSPMTFHVHDISEPIPALTGRFGLVVDSLALHYLTTDAERARALRLARSALMPGGAVLVMTMCGNPRRVPPGAYFDPLTRCLITDGIAECHYASPGSLVTLFRTAGLLPVHSTLIEGSSATGDQDMYLAILRSPAGTR